VESFEDRGSTPLASTTIRALRELANSERAANSRRALPAMSLARNGPLPRSWKEKASKREDIACARLGEQASVDRIAEGGLSVVEA